MSPSESETYRLFDVETWSFDADTFVVWNRHTDARIHLDELHHRLLQSCNSFRTLREHARSFLQTHRASNPDARSSTTSEFEPTVSSDDVNLLQRQLSIWADAGFLIRKSELRHRIEETGSDRVVSSEPSESTPIIDLLGVPTRNRPDLLRRMLRSYRANFREHGRTPTIIIADDGRTDAERTATQEAVSVFEDDYEGDLRYMSRADRRTYAHRLAQHGDVPPEVAEFGLLGSPDFPKTHGAPRNALLLDGIGRLQVQADDDTICEISVPDSQDQTLTITEGLSDTEQWFFDDFEDARKSSTLVERDFLATYERVLGRPLLGVAATRFDAGDTANLDSFPPDLFRTANESPVRIAIAQYGSVGDSGLSEHDNLFRLLLRDPTHQRLARSGNYRQNLNTRFIRRSPTNLNVGTSFPCIAMNLGLDGRTLLPPFPPVQRNEDGLFSLLFTLCCPNLCGAHLPEAILHDPPGSRSHAEFISDSSMASYFVRTGDLLEMLLKRAGTKITGDTPSARMKAIGRALLDVVHPRSESFTHLLNREVTNALERIVEDSQSLLRSHPDSPAAWRNDLTSLVETLQEAPLHSDLILPADIDGTADQKVERLHRLVEQWANLLLHWPAMHEAARDLRDEDIRPSSRV